jgi:endonuclease V-like protein UPF0215 family
LLKKEIRLLGLSAAKKKFGFLVVGVVFRGNLWLDGVISNLIEHDDPDRKSLISKTIKRSKQYSQLHAVMLAKQGLIPDHELSELASETNVPVIAVLESRPTRRPLKPLQNTNHYWLRVNGKCVHVLAAGVTKEGAEKMFAIGCTSGAKVPEAVRVAELILRQAVVD